MVTFDEKHFFFGILGNAFFGTPGIVSGADCLGAYCFESNTPKITKSMQPILQNQIKRNRIYRKLKQSANPALS